MIHVTGSVMSDGLQSENFQSEKKKKKLVSVGLGAHGVFAVGVTAHGVVSIGIISHGIVSIGVISMGVVSAGLVSMGVLTAGAVSMGIMSMGSLNMSLMDHSDHEGMEMRYEEDPSEKKEEEWVEQ